uniref:Uncharacterized protein n=1 Tax=Brassica oleracea var. oleracea TaxID=109376 RepID=A0A0D3CW53_BRAOL
MSPSCFLVCEESSEFQAFAVKAYASRITSQQQPTSVIPHPTAFIYDIGLRNINHDCMTPILATATCQNCGVNDIEDGEVETEGQHTRTEMMMRADHGEGCDSNQLRIPLPSSSSAGIPTIMVEKGAM